METQPNPLGTADTQRRLGRDVPDCQLVQLIASTLQAKQNCDASGNHVWKARHDARLARLVREYMPSGSGIDDATRLDSSSTASRLVFTFSFHHMDSNGTYDGWTDHAAIVTPSFVHEFEMRITGRNRNDIKDYLADTIRAALCQVIPDSQWVRLCEEELN